MPPEADQSSRGHVVLPDPDRSPWWSLSRRLLLGLAIIVFTVMLVYLDRNGYRDSNDPPGYAHQHRRRDLLHDRHAEHDRVRRHRAGLPRAPG